MLLQYIITLTQALCDHEGRVEYEQGETSDHYIIHVHPEDIGKVMGKQGRNINAIRHLIFCISKQQGLRRNAISLGHE